MHTVDLGKRKCSVNQIFFLQTKWYSFLGDIWKCKQMLFVEKENKLRKLVLFGKN